MNLKLTTPKETFDYAFQEPYNEVFSIRRSVDDTDGFTTLLSAGKSLGSDNFDDIKCLVIKNTSNAVLEIQMAGRWYENTTSATLDTANASRYMSWLLRANEFIYLPGIRMVGYDTDTSAANAGVVTDKTGYAVDSGNLYVDSGTTLAENVENSDTEFNVTNGTVFKVGDFIQIGINDTTATQIEILKVLKVTDTAGDGAFTPANLVVERGLNGTSAADKDAQTNGTSGAVSGAKVYLPIFNLQTKYNKYTLVQTNEGGRFHCSNLLGYGRNATDACFGIVPGSVAIKFYNKAYQELGLSGVSNSSTSGLSASTLYGFNITVDGGSEFTDLSFTTDSSNVNWGGSNGILAKIQSALNTQFKTYGSNLFEKKVNVSLINGDVRFTSDSRLSTSAIALGNATGSGGVANFFSVGRVPAIGNIETAVIPFLPSDEKYTKGGLTVKKNTSSFTYDDGHGNLVGGLARGSINYETGGINISGPSNAELVVSLIHDSAHAGGNHYGDFANVITSISARAINPRLNPVVELVGVK